MVIITVTAVAVISIILGIMILVWPKSLNIAVALWLLINGILQIAGPYIEAAI